MKKKKINFKIKYLNFGKKKKTGHNNFGKLTFRSKGSGMSKRSYRLIDFYRFNYFLQSLVIRIEYDPNRSANIALICFKNGFLSYIIATNGLKNGDIINPRTNRLGVVQQIKNLPFGTFIHCLEEKYEFGFKIARSAGSYCVILNPFFFNKIRIKLPSGEEKLFNKNNRCVIGIVSNINWKLKKKLKAGNNIWIGKKQIVRGVAKNSVDHPHGGGRGKSSKWTFCSNFTKRVLKWVTSVKKVNINIIKKKK